jgi:hypothetical protein
VHRLVPCLTALVCAAVLAGCGGNGEETAPGPTLPQGLAADLADRSDAIAASYAGGDVCGAAGQADDLLAAVLAAIDEGRVPPEFQESLTGTANKLVNEINCTEAPATTEEEAPPDCAALVEERDALEAEKKDKGKAKGRDRRLDEQIKALEQEIEACEQGEGEDGNGDGDEGDGE